MLGDDPQGPLFQWLPEENFPLLLTILAALGNHNYNSDAYIPVLQWIAQGTQENARLGKMVRMGMSQILLPAQNVW